MSANPPKNLENRRLLLFLGPHMTRLSYSLFQLPVLTSRKPLFQFSCVDCAKGTFPVYPARRRIPFVPLLMSVPPTRSEHCPVREVLVVEKESSSSTEGAVVRISGVSRRRVMALWLDRCCSLGFHNQW